GVHLHVLDALQLGLGADDVRLVGQAVLDQQPAEALLFDLVLLPRIEQLRRIEQPAFVQQFAQARLLAAGRCGGRAFGPWINRGHGAWIPWGWMVWMGRPVAHRPGVRRAGTGWPGRARRWRAGCCRPGSA